MLKLLVVKKLQISSSAFNLFFATALVAFYNQPLWRLLFAASADSLAQNMLFIASFFLLLVAIFNLSLTLISGKYLQKPLAVAIILSASMAAYFMNAYGIVFDKTMIQNTLETDSNEILDIFSSNLFIHIVLLGALPAVLIINTNIIYRPLFTECKLRALIALTSILVVVINLAVFYKDYSATFRNHREIRHLIVPSSYLYYSSRYLAGAYEQRGGQLQKIAQDASLNPLWEKPAKQLVTIIVVGETARAMNFSLNGYPRETNPELAKAAIVNFSNVSSCGTSTAVSLPCIFSSMGRDTFASGRAKNSENLLDILQNVGFEVLWRDNNSGCKSVCERIEKQALAVYRSDQFCDQQRCFDEVMLEKLDQYLQRNDSNKVIVLHQNGSHGPAYYKRYPADFRAFIPTCETADLSSCNQQSIVNSYDNSILYTDYFLSRVIKFLAERSALYTTAMLYVSDHGESLGENNLYLHGLPYYMAPKTQTNVPFFIWLSKEYQQQFGLDQHCLTTKRQQPISHDNIFHSVLGLLGVQTALYQAELDIFSSCSSPVLSSN